MLIDKPAIIDAETGPSPFHAGEQAVQTRAGTRERAERGGRRMIRDHMPDQHRELFEKLPFLAIGSLDADGRPWASILGGAPGFVASPDPRHLRIGALPPPGDPLAAALRVGAPLGLLGIELATRRRNRMNGRVDLLDDGGFAVRVEQSFGNCPQYIQARAPEFAGDGVARPRSGPAEGAALGPRARRLIAGADTFFIATASARANGTAPGEGVDVSHRGGRPGFLGIDEVDGATVLSAPDFRGNGLYNSFGNLAANPRAGLTFIDFAAGDLLMLTGTAEVIWDGPEVAALAGAERLLRFRVARGLWIGGALPGGWSSPDYAPQLDATGIWADVAGTTRG